MDIMKWSAGSMLRSDLIDGVLKLSVDAVEPDRKRCDITVNCSKDRVRAFEWQGSNELQYASGASMIMMHGHVSDKPRRRTRHRGQPRR